MRDDSGWNTDEPVPTSAAATSSQPYDGANASRIRPLPVNAIPNDSERGCGCLSVYRPINGCSSDAVIW